MLAVLLPVLLALGGAEVDFLAALSDEHLALRLLEFFATVLAFHGLSLHLRFFDVDHVVLPDRSSRVSDEDLAFLASFQDSASDLPDASVALVSDDLDYLSGDHLDHLWF